MRAELEKHHLFEILNNEKITPVFLKLAKSTNSGAQMADICRDTGEPFEHDSERKAYITDYFSTCYKVPSEHPNSVVGCIEEFLGQEILNSPLVQGNRLTLVEAAVLEGPLTLLELDESVRQANKSACGSDGLTNLFIKKFWHLFRVALCRYSIFCCESGGLSKSFRSAMIKLIQKKGDTSKIKNWRPISLLSCMYKVLSRAANNRLKRVRDRIFSRAQKGFTSSRYIQEVLINVNEAIAHCNNNNINGAILSLDQSKAFDCISHNYMREVYRFFGFGTNFTRMMEVLCNNREACIMFDDGSFSKQIRFEQGRAQGNGPSPIEYNMGQQILLFKIELAPGIRSVFGSMQVPRPPTLALPQLPGCEDRPGDKFSTEANRETDKADGFADDCTVITELNATSLSTLKDIIGKFGQFSGLKCNLDKTFLMPVGTGGGG
jgi:hypothetical protein